ncbi:hypothetical protein CsatB_030709 [Cannabis sativa]|uniref:classical arabinogalactan protein 3 n=1 Tax=Cannabis sativa TaxID=3483 RepID=UPI0029CA8240|nr:classical arabinogalactan protein 3 [Cannabis sativa]
MANLNRFRSFNSIILHLLLLTFFIGFTLSTASDISPTPPPESGADSPTSPSSSPPSPVPAPSADSPNFSSPPAPSPDTADSPSQSPVPAPSSPVSDQTPSPSPSPAADVSDINHKDMNEESGESNDSSGDGMSGGKKVGVAFGVIAAVCLVGLGGFVYKRRQDNIRRSQYGYAARREML